MKQEHWQIYSPQISESVPRAPQETPLNSWKYRHAILVPVTRSPKIKVRLFSHLRHRSCPPRRHCEDGDWQVVSKLPLFKIQAGSLQEQCRNHSAHQPPPYRTSVSCRRLNADPIPHSSYAPQESKRMLSKSAPKEARKDESKEKKRR
ncbi:hypothetical protein NDU88_000872 [Pleurodeles waltl]|uniref:Uncharacterized protein n=1 Tax=Pleurodeles waltl TaxID=8319 RepID=A0AAV7USL0_PLEWA|nr:hypothetical protein NDU88_000872 [Pleurodeles waltl]